MEIPLQLRWNVVHFTEFAFYLAAGAEYHLNKRGQMVYKDPESQEKANVKDGTLLKKSNIVGRVFKIHDFFRHGFDKK